MYDYIFAGFKHVIPFGYDHILFMVVLYLASKSLKESLTRCTVFTLAHSITLLLAGMGWIKVESAVVEPLIAFSIFIMAINNLKQILPEYSSYSVVFIFGLFHGLGFAGAMLHHGIPQSELPLDLLYFNIGVELSQLIILLTSFLILRSAFAQKSFYHQRVFRPLNLMVACIALFWTIARVLS